MFLCLFFGKIFIFSTLGNLFRILRDNGEKTLKIIKEQSGSQKDSECVKTWGINEVSALISKSRRTIVDVENKGLMPRAKIKEGSNRRYYTLEDINNFRRLFNILPKIPDHAGGFVISVANFKGGVAKTTTATHLAHYLALQGYNVLFIDCDSQGSGTQFFGLIPDTEVSDDQTLLPILNDNFTSPFSVTKTKWPNLDVIPANLSLYSAEFDLSIKHKQSPDFQFHSVLEKNINIFRKQYDIIILDCPPSLGMVSTNALFASDGIIVPLPPSVIEFSSTIQFFGMLDDVLTALNDKSFVFTKILVTKFEKSETAQAMLSIYRKIYPDNLCFSYIPTSEAIKKADANMKTIYELDHDMVSKKTFERIKIAFDEVNSEIQNLITSYWYKNEKH